MLNSFEIKLLLFLMLTQGVDITAVSPVDSGSACVMGDDKVEAAEVDEEAEEDEKEDEEIDTRVERRRSI